MINWWGIMNWKGKGKDYASYTLPWKSGHNLDWWAYEFVQSYYRKCALQICAYVFLGQKEFPSETAKRAQELIHESAGKTREIRERLLNKTFHYYIESILKETEWYEKQCLDDILPEENSELSSFKQRELGSVAFGARRYFEGLRFLDDYEKGTVEGKYGCHTVKLFAPLAVSSEICAQYPVTITGELRKEALSLLEHPGYPDSTGVSKEYADYMRKKTEVEKQITEMIVAQIMTHKKRKREQKRYG